MRVVVMRVRATARWWSFALALPVAALAAALVAGRAAAPAAGDTVAHSAPATGPKAAVAPTVPAKLSCASLVQNGTPPDPATPNFEELEGAPTRITSAAVVAATATEPEYCDVRGYIQS